MSGPRAHVIVVGSLNIDLIVGVEHLPRAGETVRGDRFVRQGGGKGANQAVAAARAGAHVTLVGAVGDDDFGTAALDDLAAAGVDVSACRRVPGEHTGLALIVVDRAGENQIAVAPGANALLDAVMTAAALDRLRPPPGSVCVVGFEVEDAAVVTTARWARRRGVRMVLNPAPARTIPAAALATGPILTPNEVEAERLTGTWAPEAAARILGERSGSAVIVSLGAEGALLWQPGEVRRFPATPVVPVDTTGAGDALNGILAAELAAGVPLDEALRWAMGGAALSTLVPGAQAGLPRREAIAELLAGHEPPG
jgi:ribokinase